MKTRGSAGRSVGEMDLQEQLTTLQAEMANLKKKLTDTDSQVTSAPKRSRNETALEEGELSEIPACSTPEGELDALFDGVSAGKEGDSDEYEDDDCLGEYLEKISPQTEGEEVSARLAKIVEARFGAGVLSSEEARAAVDKFKRPKNCPSLQTPTVNKEIFDSMSASMKKRDFKIAGAHRATVAAAATITGALDALIKARSELKGASVLEQPIKDAVEALGVLGYAGRALSQIRRDGIKPTVKAEFQGICDPEAPITPTMLFGDELVKRQRDLSTANRLNKPAGRPSPMG